MLPQAEGGDGGLTYSLRSPLPKGLSFDPETRVLSGTPTEAGGFAMTYTATDEDGDEASFGFTITVEAAPQKAESQVLPNPRNLRAIRATSDGAINPAIYVTWDPPTLSGNVTRVARYEVKLLKDGVGKVGTNLFRSADDRKATFTDLDAGAEYRVHVRAQLFVNDDYHWTPAPTGLSRTTSPPTARPETGPRL